MVKILEIPLTKRVTSGPEMNSCDGGITKFRNKNYESVSWGRVVATHGMYMGATVLAVAELAVRIAAAILAFIPMMFTEKTQTAWGRNCAAPIMVLSGILTALPMAMVNNILAKVRSEEVRAPLGHIFTD